VDIVSISNLRKQFKVLKRRTGLKGAWLDLFSRDYVYINAVNGISLKIKKGEIIGFLGPNGAGKSTTIKMMTGVLEPTEGEISILSFNPFKNRQEYVKHIGAVFGQRTQLWWELPVIESFRLQKEIFQIPKDTFENNLRLFEDLAGLQNLYEKPVRSLSLGQRMLCDIAVSFLHNPQIIFLDEPTIGLDVVVKKKVRRIIKYMNEKHKTTVILTTHDISDVEALCRRIVLIDKGRLIYDGDINQFKNLFGAYRTLRMAISGEKKKDTIKAQIFERFPQAMSLQVYEINEDWINITINEEEISSSKILAFMINNYSVRDIRIEEITIENVVTKIYEGVHK